MRERLREHASEASGTSIMALTRDILRPESDGGRGAIAGARGVGAVGSDAFDALADLFLGGGEADGRGNASARLGGLGGVDEDAASGLASGEELEMLGVIDSGRRAGAGRDFSVASGAADGADAELVGGVRGRGVELVLVGNVPGVGGAWLAQIAGREGTRGGVMLVDARGASMRVECYGARVACARGVEAAIDVGGAACARVMLCAPEVEARDLIASGRVAQVRLVSGADETSVIAAYRLLKSMVLASRRGLSAGVGGETSYSVWFVGCDAAQADDAGGRLCRAIEKFVGARIEVEPSVARLGGAGAAAASLVFESERAHSAIELAEMVASGSRGMRRGALVDWGVMPATGAELRDDRVRVGGSLRMVDEPATVDVEPPAGAVGDAVIGSGSPARSVKALMPAHAVTTATPQGAIGETPPTLASVIFGLEPLRARCPFAPGVELAIDAQGGLHAISLDDDGDCVRALTVARAWAAAHREILALTTARLIAACPVVGHLMSERPERVRHLLDADIRVHAMMRAMKPGLVALALN